MGIRLNAFRNISFEDRPVLTMRSTLQMDDLEGVVIVNEGQWALLWLFQSAALLLLVIHLAMTCLQPFEKLSILVNAINEMIFNDITTYMIVFLWLFIAFFLALFVLYPRTGNNMLPQAPSFNSYSDALLVMMRMSLLGESVDFTLMEAATDAMSTSQNAALIIWIVVYYVYAVLSIILMMNLLIAMLTTTFDQARRANRYLKVAPSLPYAGSSATTATNEITQCELPTLQSKLSPCCSHLVRRFKLRQRSNLA